MTDSAKKRLAIDLEEIERQLRQTAQQAQPSSYAPPATPGLAKGDPLAELARIVGQDDPFRSILSADRAGVEPRRIDPEFDDVFARAAPQASYPPEEYTPEDYASGRYGREDYARDEYAASGQATPDPRAYDPQPYAEEPYPDPRYARQDEWQEPSAWDAPPVQDEAGQGYAPHAGYTPHAGDARYAGAPAARDFDAYLDEADVGHAPARGPGDPRFVAAPPRAQAYDRPQDDLYADDPAYDRYAEDELYADDAPYADERPVAREPERRSRTKLALVGAVLGISVIGVAAAFVFSGDRAAPGDPPLILADEGPLKVEPQNPGGVEIPDQDRQIFERAGEEETRVVDREEQPVDVAAVARQSPRVVLPPPAASQQSRADDPIAQALAGAIAPPDELQPSAAVSAAVAELGEPRRVRTVTVRPDGTIVRNEQAAFTQAPSASGEPAARGDQAPGAYVPSAPWRAPALPQVVQNAAPAREAAPAPAAPVEIAAAPSPVAPPQPAPQAPPPPVAAPLALTGAARPAAPAPAPPQQTASVSAAPAAAAPTTIGGGYAVQLGIRDTQARAEQAFTQFRDRYSSLLGGASPIIMRAEVNGSTVYRVRVGPYALGDANTLCERIKGAGGDCFVARN